MEAFDVNIETRELGGKALVRRIKKEGYVPGILYSSNGSIPISLEEDTLRGIFNKHGEDVFIRLVHNGNPVMTKVKEVQRDPVTQDIRHIDLMPVEEGVSKGLFH